MKIAKYVLGPVILGLSALSHGAGLFSTIEAPTDINAAQAELGKKLYFDPRLSKSGFISCNSCHNLSMGGSDNLPTSIGHDWQQGPINSPTVLNSSYNLAQFWDGRAKDLKEQAGGPIANPKEMASTHELAINVLASIPAYVAEFEQVFGKDNVNIDSVTTAIAEFERTLVTPNSPFDKFLQGDKKAMSADAQAGFELFKTAGCSACHNGPALGNQAYFKMGMVKPYETSNPAQGRFSVTGKEQDKMVFKVPTLRNVDMTYPYFHDGQVQTLTEAVDIMGKIQLGRTFTAEENAQLVAFLKALTGEQPAFALPILPPSTNKTPVPVPF
jgi:cytochrome c peroxidase